MKKIDLKDQFSLEHILNFLQRKLIFMVVTCNVEKENFILDRLVLLAQFRRVSACEYFGSSKRMLNSFVLKVDDGE